MTTLTRLTLIAALPLALVACQGEQKATGGTADGEILPGSTSDAMLPLDQLRSQAPLAPHGEASSKAKDGTGAAAKPRSDKAESVEPAPMAPAAEPDANAPAG